MKKIIEFFSTKVFKQVGEVVDELFTSEEERLEARNKIFKVLQDAQLELQKMQTEIIVAEANGNWLQRSWRPILMLSFGFIIIYTKFISQLSIHLITPVLSALLLIEGSEGFFPNETLFYTLSLSVLPAYPRA